MATITNFVNDRAPYDSLSSCSSLDTTICRAFCNKDDDFVPQLGEQVQHNSKTPLEEEKGEGGRTKDSLVHVPQEVKNSMEEPYLGNIWEQGIKGIGSCLRHSYVVIEHGSTHYKPEEVNDTDFVYRGSVANPDTGVYSPGQDFVDVQSESLLEIGWGGSSTLEDVDKLFQGSSALYPPSSNDFSDGIIWDSFSPGFGNGHTLQQNKIGVSNGLEAVDDREKIALIPRESKSECNMKTMGKNDLFLMINREGQTESLPLVQSLSPQDIQLGDGDKPQLSHEAENVDTESLSTAVFKNQKLHKHPRQFEGNLRELKKRRKLVVMLDEYLQAGLSFSENYQGSMRVNSAKDSQKFEQSLCHLAGCSNSSTTLHHLERGRGGGDFSPMTPEQNLEKLCWWQQKIQGSENWLPKLINNNSPVQFETQTSLRDLAGRQPPSIPADITMATMNPNEGTVLQQLEASISNLDTITRLCIRDGCYRLACGAAERQMLHGFGRGKVHSSDYKVMEDGVSIQSDENTAISKRLMELKTETSTIDRSIVQLLFHEVFPCNGTSNL